MILRTRPTACICKGTHYIIEGVSMTMAIVILPSNLPHAVLQLVDFLFDKAR